MNKPVVSIIEEDNVNWNDMTMDNSLEVNSIKASLEVVFALLFSDEELDSTKHRKIFEMENEWTKKYLVLKNVKDFKFYD